MNKKYYLLGIIAVFSILISANAFAEGANDVGGTGISPAITPVLPPEVEPLPPVPAPGTLPPKPLPRPMPPVPNNSDRDYYKQRAGEVKDLRDQNHDAIKNKKEDIRDEIKEKRELLKNTLGLKMQVRFEALMNRLSKIAARIQARIDEMKNDGVDVAKAQSDLDTAKATIVLVTEKAKSVVMVQGDDQATKDANKAAIDEIKALADKAKKELMVATYDLKANKK